MTRLLAPFALVLLGLCACGAPELVTPDPLRVLDTYPSNGALVSSVDVPLVLVFSAPVDTTTLDEALLLEEVAAAGTPIAVVPTALAEYLPQSLSASYTTPALAPDTAYMITVKQDRLRAEDGRQLLTDLVRRFKTTP